RLIDLLLNEQRHVAVLVDCGPNGELRADVAVLNDLIARWRVGREAATDLHKRPLRTDQEPRLLIVRSEQHRPGDDLHVPTTRRGRQRGVDIRSPKFHDLDDEITEAGSDPTPSRGAVSLVRRLLGHKE